MKLPLPLLFAVSAFLTATRAPAAVLYVDVNGTNPILPYADWSTAATNIQNAVDAAAAGDEILVTDGTYASGSRVAGSASTRLVVSQMVMVRSVNGPQFTFIEGSKSGAVRCAYLNSGAVLTGFTLTNGAVSANLNGGGVQCTTASAVVSNCTIVGCSAPQGGGACGGTLNNCTLVGNAATTGGGACASVLNNCTLSGNSASTGGGAAELLGGPACILSGCLVVSNSANVGGGGANCTFTNCILGANSASSGGGVSQGLLSDCLLTNNVGTNGGGGAYGICTLLHCTLSGNSSGGGGGAGGGVTLVACLLSGNSTTGSGGGANGGTLTNCTLQSNVAAKQGGGTAGANLTDCTLSYNYGGSGGGGYGGSMNRCFLVTNSASIGGGANSSLLTNCALVGNVATNQAGGAYGATLNNCLVLGNQGLGTDSTHQFGGGIVGGTANNCTIVGNSSGTYCGGACGGTLNNCILFYNAAQSEVNYPTNNTSLNYCCTTPLPANGLGNITSEPLFVDLAGGNLRLQSNSPCINAGKNTYASTAQDLDGNSRTIGGAVDLGAYEFLNPTSLISYAWLQQYALPLDGTADFIDTDGDGLNNWEEWKAGTDPRNPASVLKMLALSNSAPGLTLNWQSVSGTTYYLQRSTNLATKPAFSTVQSNIVGQADITSFMDTNALGAGPFFYRLGVQ